MSFCGQCGTKLEEGIEICPSCGADNSKKKQAVSTPGAAISSVAVTENSKMNNANNSSAAKPSDRGDHYVASTGARGFVSEDEKPIYSLKNGFSLNLLSGEGWKSEDAVITNKRIYYNDKVGIINASTEENIIDIEDVTCAKFINYNPIGWIALAILSLCIGCYMALFETSYIFFGAIAAIVFASVYASLRKAFFAIYFAGGNIKFSVKKYGVKNIREFQRCIFTVKEKAKK